MTCLVSLLCVGEPKKTLDLSVSHGQKTESGFLYCGILAGYDDSQFTLLLLFNATARSCS